MATPPPTSTSVDAPSGAWAFPEAPAEDAATRKSRAGRRPGAVWAYFTPLRTEQNKTHAACRFCSRRCAGVAARMAAHILHKCPSVPAHEVDALTAALAHEPPEKRQRLDTGLALSGTGLAAFGDAEDGALRAGAGQRKATKDASHAGDAMGLALQRFVVACLRHNAPLEVIGDEFFREALSVLRPGSSATLKTSSAATLLEKVGATVASEATQWMRSSECFTLIHNSSAREWRGADDRRRSVLIAEDNGGVYIEWLAKLISRLEFPGSNAIVGLCCDSMQVYQEVSCAVASVVTPPPESPLRRVTLLSKCLLTTTLQLWTLVTNAISNVYEVVVRAAEAVQTLVESSTLEQSIMPPLEYLWKDLDLDWTLIFLVLKRVEEKSQMLKLLETGASISNDRDTFWGDLPAVNTLLKPFAWLLTLSESKSIGSSHFVLGWMSLISCVENSPLIPLVARDRLSKDLLAVIGQAVDDHHLVALLLDPRVRGVALSPTGRRKVKTLVVQVASRLWGSKLDAANSDESSPPPASARHALLAQLGHFMEKTEYFADEVAWEMARGTGPENFWKDYAQDAPELTALARAVLAFVPVVSQTSERLEAANDSIERPPFETRQIRFHFERNRKLSEFEMSSVIAKHAELLSTAEAPLSRGSPDQSAVNLVEAVKAQWLRLRAVAPTPLEHEALPLVSGLEASWFATQGDAARAEIEAALRSFLPPTVGVPQLV